jgi:exodeoxyribonuclease V alpha subunit
VELLSRVASPRFSAEQQAVVDRVLAAPGSSLAAKIAAVTGPPGSGKTTLSKGIMGGCARLFGQGSAMALSPTGKAARRFTEVTGHPCATIHRALIAWERAAKAADDPGATGNAEWNAPEGIVPRGALRAVLVDEASMVDMQLMLRLMRALPPWTERIVLVGDADQLPSVGAGCVLRDLMASGRVPTFRLTQIYRQDDRSWIRVNTQRINRGERPVADPQAIDYFERLHEDDAGAAIDSVVALAKERPGAQVLTPTNRGALGAENLNRLVREAVNPAAGRTGWKAGDIEFLRGDRVIQIKNNYDLDVFNGETAVVVGPIPDPNGGDDLLAVDFDGRKVLYDMETAAEGLRLAFALTVHKAQGGEADDVVVVLHSSHSFLLSRQLAYVALSRARKRAWIVGDEKGVQRAVRNNQTMERRTRLAERIREAFSADGTGATT